jgi:hypothetical protein
MPIRAFTPVGQSNEFTVAEAIKYATDHGADVINMSFGTPTESSILRAAIEYAYQRNAIMVAALGNEATDTPQLYPARYVEEVIGIAAVDSNDKVSFFSNFGTHASMSALGQSIISAYPGADYAMWSGTSFATPLIGAEAALLVSADRSRRVARQVMEQTALNIDPLNSRFAGLIGKGRLRPLNALKVLNTNAALNPTVDLESRLELTSGAGLPSARGHAEVSVTGSLQELRVTAYRLVPGSTYRLVIDGQQKGSMVAGAFGSVSIVMSSNPGAHAIQLPDDLQPVTGIDRIELLDGQGELVLSGDFDPVVETANPNQSLLKEARLVGASASSGPIALAAVTPIGSVGHARVEVDSDRQVLSLSLETPASAATYYVFVDGVNLGGVAAKSSSLSVSYPSDGPAFPAAISPFCNVRQIKIVDSQGKVVASGTFQIPGGNVGM